HHPVEPAGRGPAVRPLPGRPGAGRGPGHRGLHPRRPPLGRHPHRHRQAGRPGLRGGHHPLALRPGLAAGCPRGHLPHHRPAHDRAVARRPRLPRRHRGRRPAQGRGRDRPARREPLAQGGHAGLDRSGGLMTTGTDRISDEHIAHWHEHGWVIVPDFLTPGELKEARENLERYFPSWEEYAAAAERYEAMPFWREFPYVGDALNNITTHPELIAFVEQALGTPDVFITQG